MKRHVTIITLLCTLAFVSCSSEDGGDIIAPASPYKNLSKREHVLQNLELAMKQQNLAEYTKMLDDNFVFYFSQNDIDDPDINVPTQWDRNADMSAASNMFSGVAPPGQDPIDAIDVRLTYAEGEDEWVREPGEPNLHPGEDWFIKVVIYNMTIQLDGPDTFLSQNIKASFYVRYSQQANGWRIVAWYDDAAGSPLAALQVAASTSETTWGVVKTLYAHGGAPPGASPVEETTWGSIKSLYSE